MDIRKTKKSGVERLCPQKERILQAPHLSSTDSNVIVHSPAPLRNALSQAKIAPFGLNKVSINALLAQVQTKPQS
jgi:hypothetical protein